MNRPRRRTDRLSFQLREQKKAFLRQDFIEADRYLSLLIGADPDSAYAKAGMAELAIFEGDVSKAQGLFEEALALLPHNSRDRLYITAQYVNTGYQTLRLGEITNTGWQLLLDTDAAIYPVSEVARLRATLSGALCTLSLPSDGFQIADWQDERLAEDVEARFNLSWARAFALYQMQDFAASHVESEEALKLAISLDSILGEAAICNLLASCKIEIAPDEEAAIRALIARAIEIYEGTNSTVQYMLALGTWAVFESKHGDKERADELFDRCFTGLPGGVEMIRSSLLCDLAAHQLSKGDVAAGQMSLREALILLQSADSTTVSAKAWQRLASSYEDIGDMDLALTCLKASYEAVR